VILEKFYDLPFLQQYIVWNYIIKQHSSSTISSYLLHLLYLMALITIFTLYYFLDFLSILYTLFLLEVVPNSSKISMANHIYKLTVESSNIIKKKLPTSWATSSYTGFVFNRHPAVNLWIINYYLPKHVQ
jgi:hypothetical protein